jgi:hypothetical protein
VVGNTGIMLREGEVGRNGNQQYLKQVEQFKYLGALEDKIAGMDKELASRRQRTEAALSSKSQAVFMNKRIRLRTKLLTYLSFGKTCLLYGSSCWTTRKDQFKQLESVQIQNLRQMMGLRWDDYVSYTDMLDRAKKYGGVELLPIEAYVRESRLRFLGHIERMTPYRLPYRVLHGEVGGGGRLKGKPERQYRHCLKEDLQLFGINVDTWQQLAKNRKQWRLAVKTGLVTFVEKWRIERNSARLKQKVGEERRRVEKGLPSREEQPRPPKEDTIRELDEEQNQIPSVHFTVTEPTEPSLVARIYSDIISGRGYHP